MRGARGWFALSSGAVVGLALGCMVDVVHRIACGDGYVDGAAGEECDPGDPDSYERACNSMYGGGTAGCDPVTCRLLVNDVQCAFCGDGRVNVHPANETDSEGEMYVEECDGNDLNGAVCPDGAVQLRCDGCVLDWSDCHYCGDGIVDPGEECESIQGLDDLAAERACAPDLDGTPSIDSPYFAGRLYGSGIATCDIDNCEWFRGNCSYCGNDELDDDETLVLDYAGVLTEEAEVCDGDHFSPTAIPDAYRTMCADDDPLTEDSDRPNVRCVDECETIELAVGEPPCCRAAEEFCPSPSDGIECCYAYLHPEDPKPCEPSDGVRPATCK